MRRVLKYILILVIAFLCLVCDGCNKVEYDDKPLDVKSSDGQLSPSHIVVHYKTNKGLISNGEDFQVSISFGSMINYSGLEGHVLKKATAELTMYRKKYSGGKYETIEKSILKTVDDFSTSDYFGTFTSEENIITIDFSKEWFEYSAGSFIFSVRVIEDYSTDEENDVRDIGVGAGLFYHVYGEKIKFYGRQKDFEKGV